KMVLERANPCIDRSIEAAHAASLLGVHSSDFSQIIGWDQPFRPATGLPHPSRRARKQDAASGRPPGEIARKLRRKKRIAAPYAEMQRVGQSKAAEGFTMARSYYSVMLYHPADEVWAVIRPFDHYAWAGVESETIIEHGKAGDQVGAVRRVSYGGRIIRQVLLAHSDIERSYTYAFCGAPPFPVQDYVA